MVMVSNQSNMAFGYLAGRYPGSVGHLYSPGGQRGPYPWMPYALDNGAWSAHTTGTAWRQDEWRRLLHWACLSGLEPLWVLIPDVVGKRRETLDLWREHVDTVLGYGWRPAFAAQDSMTFDDVPADAAVVFLGGSTEWKDGAIAPWCERFPGRVHVGRVNRWDRLVRSWRAGAASVDGTGWFHEKNGQRGELFKFISETWRSVYPAQEVTR